MAISSLLLADMPAHDRADTKAREIVLLVQPARYVGSYGATIEIQQPTHTERVAPRCCGVEVLARAWTTADGKSIGFGRDGSVEWERFRIYNPPILVPDGTTHTENGLDGTTYQANNFKEDPVAALREVIAHNIVLVGKPGAAVTSGKIGHTTSTFYPDANVESTSVDGYIYVDPAVSWALAHDATVGDAAPDSETNGYVSVAATFRVYRFACLFDTSAIPDTDTISAATLSLWATGAITNGDDDGDDFVAIVTSSPASNTGLVSEDFDQFGTTEQHDVGQRKDLTSMSTGIYTDWTLNATGRGNISKTSITKFGAREGHDILNSAPVGTNTVNFSSADTAGTTQDPKLVVTHAGASTFAPKMFLVF